MIKAVFFDVDGTLISSERPYVSNKVIEALKKLREAHPYEEPAINLIPLIDEESL